MPLFSKTKFLARLGSYLSKVRKKFGFSQDRLTDEAGLARGTISKIETGSVDPRVTTIAKIADALELPPKKLLDIR